MNKLNKKLRTLFFFALALSIGFPLGVLGIIFGASQELTPLLVCGIVLTVAGFYGMPLLWVRYGERRGDRFLLCMIEEDGITSLDTLCVQSGYPIENVRARIKRMIANRELVGFLLSDGGLQDPSKKDEERPTFRKCPNCGATMVAEDAGWHCEYCLHREAF